MPARLQINFAAGPLEAPLSERAAPHDSPRAAAAIVAQRDLERYYALLADELARVTLSEAEALVVVAAMRSWLIEPTSYRYLWAEVDDYLAGQLEDLARPGADELPVLDAPARAVLVAKLRALSPGQTLAVLDACERLWRAVQADGPTAELGIPVPQPTERLRAVGLVR